MLPERLRPNAITIYSERNARCESSAQPAANTRAPLNVSDTSVPGVSSS